jgi:hypothetical protein
MYEYSRDVVMTGHRAGHLPPHVLNEMTGSGPVMTWLAEKVVLKARWYQVTLPSDGRFRRGRASATILG